VGNQLATQPRALSDHEYRQLKDRIAAVVEAVLPSDANLLVVSKGDPDLVSLNGLQAAPFPQTDKGLYAGHHPEDSADAIEQLEKLRKRGAQYLLFPSTTYWWFDHYRELKHHLDTRYRVVVRQPDCAIYALSKGELNGVDTAGGDVVRELLPRRANIAVATVPDGESELMVGTDEWRGLEDLEEREVDFLVILRPGFDWLERHPELKAELDSRHRFVTRQEHVCTIYELLRQ
jgi:hypothetical protein